MSTFLKMTEIRIENHELLLQYVERYRQQIETALRRHMPTASPKFDTQFDQAVEYALFPSENRWYAVLTLLSGELFGGKPEILLPAAVAVEFIYTSTLIFDDLPCMNRAPANEGKISLHEKFDENLEIFVAVGLLNASYSLVFVNHSGMPERAMRAHAEIVECVGESMLIGGQSTDQALMRLAMRIGAILAGANHLELAQLSRFAELLGIADRNADDDAKRILVENFPSSEARTCLIQLTDYLLERKV